MFASLGHSRWNTLAKEVNWPLFKKAKMESKILQWQALLQQESDSR
jgi:hypothetical protein